MVQWNLAAFSWMCADLRFLIGKALLFSLKEGATQRKKEEGWKERRKKALLLGGVVSGELLVLLLLLLVSE